MWLLGKSELLFNEEWTIRQYSSHLCAASSALALTPRIPTQHLLLVNVASLPRVRVYERLIWGVALGVARASFGCPDSRAVTAE